MDDEAVGIGIFAGFATLVGSSYALQVVFTANDEALNNATKAWPEWAQAAFGLGIIALDWVVIIMVGRWAAQKADDYLQGSASRAVSVLGYGIGGAIVFAALLTALILYLIFLAFFIMIGIVAVIMVTSD